jgi:hypothetical protein
MINYKLGETGCYNALEERGVPSSCGRFSSEENTTTKEKEKEIKSSKASKRKGKAKDQDKDKASKRKKGSPRQGAPYFKRLVRKSSRNSKAPESG